MASNFRKSDSIAYALSQWFDEIVATQTQYPEILDEVIKTCKDEFLTKAIELQKQQGTKRSQSLFKEKEQLVSLAKGLEPKITELIDFVYDYKMLVEDIDGFELDISTPQTLLKKIGNDIETLENLEISLKNIIKAANAAFKRTKSKSVKKLEEDYENHVKNFSTIIKRMDKDFRKITEQFDFLIKELQSEVDKAKKLGEEKVA